MIEKNKVLVVDIDGTLCGAPQTPGDYLNATPYTEMIERLHALREQGFYIILHTSRQMRTYEGNIGQINAHMLPILIEWLQKHQVAYDEIHVGKPWCGKEGFYIDDRAVRPLEFLSLSPEEINKRLDEEKKQLAKINQSNSGVQL